MFTCTDSAKAPQVSKLSIRIIIFKLDAVCIVFSNINASKYC